MDESGRTAFARSAYREPLAYFDRALTLARSLPESPARTRQILDLLLLLGEAHSRNRNVSEALKRFKEAFELARKVNSPADLARAAVGATVSETSTGGRALESHALMEAALAALGDAETVERSRLLEPIQLPLTDVGRLRAGGCAEPSGTRRPHSLPEGRVVLDRP